MELQFSQSLLARVDLFLGISGLQFDYYTEIKRL